MAYFFKILIPVCTPIIATISMWNFVGMWNSYFDAMIYLKDAREMLLRKNFFISILLFMIVVVGTLYVS